MALENGNDLVMPVAPAYGGGGFGGFGGDWGSLIVLFLIAAMFGGFGNGFGGMGGGYDFPWLMSGQENINANTNSGFRDSMIQNGITSVRDGISGLATQLCNSSANIVQTVSGGFADAEIANNARQIANMQTAFAGQNAMNQGFNGISAQLAQCCCDNRLATAQTQALVQSENCADRAVLSDGIRDIITNQTANTQRILDTMCQDKIDAKNEKIADLERQLTMANLASSQALQTQQLIADNALQTNALEQYLAPTPRPAYIVQNPNCCYQNTGCGCGNF